MMYHNTITPYYSLDNNMVKEINSIVTTQWWSDNNYEGILIIRF